MATTEDGIWTPDQIDDYNLVADLATMSSTVQDALEKRANAFKGTSAQRVAFSSAEEGVIWVDTNGSKKVWVRQGNTWKEIYPNRDDLVPTSGAVYDTGWTNFSATVGTVENPKVRRVGKQVFFTGILETGNIGGGFTKVATVPAGFRPSTGTLYFRVDTNGRSAIPHRVRVYVNGDMQVDRNTGNRTYLSGITYAIG